MTERTRSSLKKYAHNLRMFAATIERGYAINKLTKKQIVPSP